MCKRQLPNILIMDNFDLRKYLAEGKLLKEEFVKGTPQYYVKYTTLDGKEVKSELMSKREAIYKERDLIDSGIKKSSVYNYQKNMDLNGKEYEIEYELDKDIEYRTDDKGKPIDENKLLKEDNLRDYWSEWAAGEIEVGNDGVIDAGGVDAEFEKVSDEAMNTFKDYVKAVKALDANSKELRNDIAGAVSTILYDGGDFEDYTFDVLTADQYTKIQDII